MSKEQKEHGKELRERICRFIADYTSEHSYAPTVREIGASVGLKSSANVHSHLVKLQIEGRIEIKPYCPRAIRVIKN